MAEELKTSVMMTSKHLCIRMEDMFGKEFIYFSGSLGNIHACGIALKGRLNKIEN